MHAHSILTRDSMLSVHMLSSVRPPVSQSKRLKLGLCNYCHHRDTVAPPI